MINMERTGARLSRLRKAHGMTQAELAARLMVSPQAVSKWETGQSLPDIEQLLAVSQLFGVTINSILTGEVQTAGGFHEQAATGPLPSCGAGERAHGAGERVDSAEERSRGGDERIEEERVDEERTGEDKAGGERTDREKADEQRSDENRVDEGAPRSRSLEMILGLAPLLDEDTLGELLEECDWSDATLAQLYSVAPHLSSDVLDRLAVRVPRPSASDVVRLAPYLGSSTLARLLVDSEDKLSCEHLRQVTAYLEPEDCSRVFTRLLDEPGDHSFDELASFAPYVTAEALEALVRAVPPPNLEALKKVTVHLEDEEVGRVLRGLLGRENQCR